MDSFARTDTQKKHGRKEKIRKTAKTVRKAKRKVYATVESAKTTRGALPHKNARGLQDAGRRSISVCSCVIRDRVMLPKSVGLGNGHSEEE